MIPGIKDIENELYNWVSDNIVTYEKKLKLDIKNDLFKVFNYLMEYKQANKLLKLISNNINDEEVVEIYIYFLESIHLNKLDLVYNSYQNIIDSFYKHKNYPIIIPKILSNPQIKNNEKINDYLLNKLKNNIISLEEVYSSNVTQNIKLVDELRKNNFFNDEKYQKYEYTKKTKEIIDIIKSNFQNGNINYEKASNILSNYSKLGDYQYKFRLLFLYNEKNDEENTIKLSCQFKDDVLKIQVAFKDLDEIKKYFENFYSNSKQKEISSINDLNIFFRKNKLNSHKEIVNQNFYKDIMKYYEEAKANNNLIKESLCFKRIYENEKLIIQKNQEGKNEKKEKENLIMKNTIKKFNDLKNIFQDEKIKNINDNIKFLSEFYLANNNEELLYKQISFLKKYFNINIEEETVKKIKLNIIIFALINKISYILPGLKEIYNIFKENIKKNEEEDIMAKIDFFLEEIKNENIEREKVEEIISFLKNLNIYLIGEESQKNKIITNVNNDTNKFNIGKVL